MADVTQHDAADDAFHEIQLSGKQLVFLFMATTLGLVFVFLLGVQVGRNAKGDRASESQDTVASATVPPPASTPSSAPSASESGPPAAEPPAPAAESDDELSYAKRLQGDSASSEKLKPEAASAPAKSAPAKSVDAKPAASAPAAAKPAAPAPSGGRPGVWVVQLVALKDHAAASAVAQQLVAKGYPAFVVSPAAGAPPIFRVQVGRYNDRREAEQVARRLEKEGQFKPWISH